MMFVDMKIYPFWLAKRNAVFNENKADERWIVCSRFYLPTSCALLIISVYAKSQNNFFVKF